ncbi:hypothetical protein BD410DRAFT_381259 [Rickenella mellea]|uniref:Uncharacterized protein n=1 Tax=Rickenella mellea TaxID=50990 RepID=A0A4Y7PEC1_9AGAM|nr:hypothetical protein BD410DRAFT_381259 [Rickenella mellea]
MARRPEDLQTHMLTAESYDASQHNLPLYAQEARAHELEFKHPRSPAIALSFLPSHLVSESQKPP